MFRKHLETTETLRNEVRRDLEHFDAEFASGDGAVTNHAVDTCRAVESAASGDDNMIWLMICAGKLRGKVPVLHSTQTKRTRTVSDRNDMREVEKQSNIV